MTSWDDPIGFVKVALWYRGATTGAQSGRASGSPCTARVEKPRRRFRGPLRSRQRQREGPSGGAGGEPPRDELLEQRSEEHTSELQSRLHLVCRLLLEKKNTKN